MLSLPPQTPTSMPMARMPSTSPQVARQRQMQMFDDLLRIYEQSKLFDDLAYHVQRAFDRARQHRISTGTDTAILRSMRAVAMQFDPEDMPLVQDSGVDIYVGLTNLKVRALKAWITDILANSDDKPWTLKASPLPELPPEAEEAVVDALTRELEMFGLSADLRDRAKFFKDVAQKHADKIAAEATARMETKIEDLMIEGGWRSAFGDFLADLTVFPSAVIKGPIAERVPGMRWVDGELRVVERVKYVMRRVHPLDIFPSSDSTTTQDGEYIVERQRVSRHELLKAIGIPGFLEPAIRQLILEHPEGYEQRVGTDASQEAIEGTSLTGDGGTGDGRWHVLAYHGRVPGRLLALHGVQIDDPQRPYEAEVWVCAGKVIRAMLNPHPLAQRPYHMASFEMVPGSIWGRSMPMLLRDVQRMCNAAARSLVRNMAFASGPVGEYDIERMAHETDIQNIRPFRLYATTTDPLMQSSQPALRFQKLDSNATELIKVFDYWSKIADDLSGVPAYVLGNPAVAGAGRTLGGLSMLMGNAAKGVKMVIATVDRHAIEPIVRAYHTMVMMFDPDRSLKADANVIARGSSGLLMRELQQHRSLEALQMLTPYATGQDENGQPVVPVDGLRMVIRDVLRSLGYTADEILPDPERYGMLQQFAGQQGGPSSEPGTPMPALDGRSQPGGVDPLTASNLPASGA